MSKFDLNELFDLITFEKTLEKEREDKAIKNWIYDIMVDIWDLRNTDDLGFGAPLLWTKDNVYNIIVKKSNEHQNTIETEMRKEK